MSLKDIKLIHKKSINILAKTGIYILSTRIFSKFWSDLSINKIGSIIFIVYPISNFYFLSENITNNYLLLLLTLIDKFGSLNYF